MDDDLRRQAGPKRHQPGDVSTHSPHPGQRAIRNQVIPNVGSAARDHLANERTFLAWIRTALGIIGLGVVVTKLVVDDALVAELTGLSFVVLGVLGGVYALQRYRRITNHLSQGLFPVARLGPLGLAAVVLLVAGVAAFLILK